MDNQPSAQPHFELPVPDQQLPKQGGEAVLSPPDLAPRPPAPPEKLPAAGNVPGSPPPLSVAPQGQAMQPVGQAMPVPGAPAPAAMPALSSVPASADDTDLIEKEWVEKAKAIVERTRLDPHQQNKEINRFKAEYIKKRYNKDILVADK